MIPVKPRFQSFAEYLSYDDGTDKLYELFNGELIEVPHGAYKRLGNHRRQPLQNQGKMCKLLHSCCFNSPYL
ncbi:hypothetical protein H1P_1880002 [Hyella patelloides LEGE 07179]|uniref:Uncharacterized protein n=1 Tax=Hyella patelloides LEGE 07179 TaxID=945734 RepID=A0A563VP40_9CYAN|nr:hypothetical protein H1P_1880002 [Hyella patelloides LEGE 07179]